MQQSDFEQMPLDDLWALHLELSDALASRMEAERVVLCKRLDQLARKHDGATITKFPRKPYPDVLPKFQNPDDPSETWSGRGRQPRWFAEQVASGRKADDFRITLDAAE